MAKWDVGARTYCEYTHALNKSVSELVDGEGRIRAAYDYGLYGDLLSVSGDLAGEKPFRFSSEYYDGDLGLVYYNYRHYNPQEGRWISRDPLEEVGGYNLYLFVANALSHMVDYRGAFFVFGAGIGAIIGAVSGAVGGVASGGGWRGAGAGGIGGLVGGAIGGAIVNPAVAGIISGAVTSAVS